MSPNAREREAQVRDQPAETTTAAWNGWPAVHSGDAVTITRFAALPRPDNDAAADYLRARVSWTITFRD
jgi:hypothetical protein